MPPLTDMPPSHWHATPPDVPPLMCHPHLCVAMAAAKYLVLWGQISRSFLLNTRCSQPSSTKERVNYLLIPKTTAQLTLSGVAMEIAWQQKTKWTSTLNWKWRGRKSHLLGFVPTLAILIGRSWPIIRNVLFSQTKILDWGGAKPRKGLLTQGLKNSLSVKLRTPSPIPGSGPSEPACSILYPKRSAQGWVSSKASYLM